MNDFLKKILHPINSNSFIENYYGKNYLHIKRDDSHYYDSLFSVKDADILISSNSLLDRNLKLSKIGPQIFKEEYLIYQDKRKVHKVQVENVLDLFNDNATIIIDDIGAFNRKILNLEIELSEFLGFVEIIFTNLYLSPKDSQAFPIHYDTQEVIVLQIAGRKKWTIYEDFKNLFPIDYSFDERLDHVQEEKSIIVDLMPGDFLYLPRGAAHEVSTNKEEPSLHLTISILPYTTANLLSGIINFIEKENTDFRKTLSNNWKIDLDLIKQLTSEICKEESLKSVSKIFRSKNNYSHYYDYSGFLNLIFQNEKMTDFKFRKGVLISFLNNETLIKYGKKELLIEGNLLELNNFVLNQKPFSINDLNQLFDPEVSKDILSLLVSESLVLRIDVND